MKNEFELIEQYFTPKKNLRKDVLIGIGDDGAVVQPPKDQELVIATDSLIAGVHFPLNTAAKALGHKALAVNLSDLAAMGATPAWALLAITLPYIDETWIADFASGFQTLLNQYEMQLIGGDTCQGNLTVNCQVIGFVPKGKALKRTGAKKGGEIYISGKLGRAGAALSYLKGFESKIKDANHALYFPEPQIELGIQLREIASSAIDVSDGLVADLQHILDMNQCGAEINLEKLPIHPSLKILSEKNQLKYALAAGDEYQLLFTVSKENITKIPKELNVTQIGKIKDEQKLILKNPQGELLAANEFIGYRHFG